MMSFFTYLTIHQYEASSRLRAQAGYPSQLGSRQFPSKLWPQAYSLCLFFPRSSSAS